MLCGGGGRACTAGTRDCPAREMPLDRKIVVSALNVTATAFRFDIDQALKIRQNQNNTK
jgi:hypothetical protein